VGYPDIVGTPAAELVGTVAILDQVFQATLDIAASRDTRVFVGCRGTRVSADYRAIRGSADFQGTQDTAD
jgi:hypothetical protein